MSTVYVVLINVRLYVHTWIWPMIKMNFLCQLFSRCATIMWYVIVGIVNYLFSCSLQQYRYSVGWRKEQFGGSSGGVLPGTVGDSV